MTSKKVPIHMIFTGVHSLLAVLTLLPTRTAGKACALGYNALCSFSPISTVILFALGGLHVFLHMRTRSKEV
jgi:hypothetical protein